LPHDGGAAKTPDAAQEEQRNADGSAGEVDVLE